jgi:nickel-dependent lactate racemase
MIKLLKQKGDLTVDLPLQWEVKQTIFMEGHKVGVPLIELMMSALAEPINSSRLDQLLKPDSKVAIVVDDITHPTRINHLVPRLLEVISNQGIPQTNVDRVIGTGTHRPLTDREIEDRLSSAIVQTYRVRNHDSKW